MTATALITPTAPVTPPSPITTTPTTRAPPTPARTAGAAGLWQVAAAPSSVPVGKLAVAAAIDDDASHSPIHPMPAPEDRHDWPRRTPGPADPDPERAEPEITGRDVDR